MADCKGGLVGPEFKGPYVILFLVPDRQLIYKDLKCKQDSSALLPVSAVVTA